ncbi:hypothetical protein FH972_005641 [Carpinus fangiana]|uniref:Uncharacterized protein n=1 Tax=Carpinus fangiana TaxID=176857 RepID=A0A5N6QPV4_9ROSI|nr:hypothetical protein FH972_005641 [Carpinus fangiana]
MIIGYAKTGGENLGDIHAEVSHATANVQLGLNEGIAYVTWQPRVLGRKLIDLVQQGGSPLPVTENEVVGDFGEKVHDGVCEGNNSVISGSSHSQRGDNIGNNLPVCEGCNVTGVAIPKITLGDSGSSESTNLVAPSSVVGKLKEVGKENIDIGQQGGSALIVSPKNGTWKKKALGIGGITLV